MTAPGRGAYQRAGCGRWAPHRAPGPLMPLGCHLEPLQLHPVGICDKSREVSVAVKVAAWLKATL